MTQHHGDRGVLEDVAGDAADQDLAEPDHTAELEMRIARPLAS